MARTDKTKTSQAAPLFAAGLLTALCVAAPALAQSASQEEDGYHSMPHQFLLNKWISPSEETKKEEAQAEAKDKVEQKQAEEVRAQTGESVYGQNAPNQFLINRFFGSGK